MKLLSWNLFGLCDDDLDLRTEAAMFEALLGGPLEEVVMRDAPPSPPPDVLMFQEVVDRTLDAHLRPHLSAAGYTLLPTQRSDRSYYEIIATGPNVTVHNHHVHSLDSGQGREVVEASITVADTDYVVMTGHLESLPSGKRLRMEQARWVVERLRAMDGPAVFAGDTNLRQAEADTLGPLPDAWEVCGEDSTRRWTHMRKHRTARYDRIWGHMARFSDFNLVGRRPVTPTGDPPSDHLGVTVRINA
jgi:endonuclease/exonuclease/phosphatase family metal-dependent hydrolase